MRLLLHVSHGRSFSEWQTTQASFVSTVVWTTGQGRSEMFQHTLESWNRDARISIQTTDDSTVKVHLINENSLLLLTRAFYAHRLSLLFLLLCRLRVLQERSASLETMDMQIVAGQLK